MRKGAQRARRIIKGAALISKLIGRPALDRQPNLDDKARLLIPGRVSANALRSGYAEIVDLHNIIALLNVGMVLAHRVGESAAREAIQAGIFAMIEVKDRPGPRYAMNSRQRELVMQAVDLADELFCCCTLLELAAAHSVVMKALPKTGSLDLVEIEAA